MIWTIYNLVEVRYCVKLFCSDVILFYFNFFLRICYRTYHDYKTASFIKISNSLINHTFIHIVNMQSYHLSWRSHRQIVASSQTQIRIFPSFEKAV